MTFIEINKKQRNLIHGKCKFCMETLRKNSDDTFPISTQQTNQSNINPSKSFAKANIKALYKPSKHQPKYISCVFLLGGRRGGLLMFKRRISFFYHIALLRIGDE